MVEYKNVLSSWNLRSSIPKEVLSVCKKLNVYLPCYLYGECLGDIIFLNKKPDFFQIISQLDMNVVNQIIPGSEIKSVFKDHAYGGEELIVEANINGINIVITPLGRYIKSILITSSTIESLLLSTPFYHNSFIYDVDKNMIGFSSFDKESLFRPDMADFYYGSYRLHRQLVDLTRYDIFKYALVYKAASYLNSDAKIYRALIRSLDSYDFDIQSFLDSINQKQRFPIDDESDDVCYKNEISSFLEPHIYPKSLRSDNLVIDPEHEIAEYLNDSLILDFIEGYIGFLIPQFKTVVLDDDYKHELLMVIGRLLFNSYYSDESMISRYKYLDGKYGAAVIVISIFVAIARGISPNQSNNIIQDIFNNSKISQLLPSETVNIINKVLNFYKRRGTSIDTPMRPLPRSSDDDIPVSLILLTKEAKKEFGEYYMVALAPLFIRSTISIFENRLYILMDKIDKILEENKENLEISDSVDEGIRTFIVDNNYYINPQAFSTFIAPILKNKIKNNIISGDVDSIIKAIEEILILL